MYRYHAECCRSVAELYCNHNACKLRVCSTFEAGNHRQFQDGRGYRSVRGQLRFVTNTASGMGLIKCGSVVITFDNQISKDTDLYKLYNTNIHEIIEQKKHANEKC